MASRTKPGDMRVHPVLRRLFEEMREQKWTFERLSGESGVSSSTINKWPVGGNPNLLNLVAVAEVLGLEIFIRENPMDEDTKAMLGRLRRKIEIVRLDMKARENSRSEFSSRKSDMDEMLSLVDMLERRLGGQG